MNTTNYLKNPVFIGYESQATYECAKQLEKMLSERKILVLLDTLPRNENDFFNEAHREALSHLAWVNRNNEIFAGRFFALGFKDTWTKYQSAQQAVSTLLMDRFSRLPFSQLSTPERERRSQTLR